MNNKERRLLNCEVRMAEGDGEGDSSPLKIIGYGSVFDSRSENLGGFREVIAPGAFDSVLDDDVRALFNHDHNFVLGRTKSGTLSLVVDEKGLRYEITPPDTQTVRDLLIEPLRRNDIDQSSFAFSVARGGEEWDEDEDGVIVRTITKFSRLYDVSPVTFPAYPEAGAAVRSLEAWKREQGQDVLKRAVSESRMRERFLQIINA
ncbi:HK97 family phage prohead protease [Neptuniibacter pectenicola]|uniref:HK97 family phage prohead protease n=1 Tax=Neptuniibacter pectenicola TaxID=1806669 RepID=UPI0008379F1B|nr:HK97 family phage prohead protease [Neptuniibacter pectenicola]